MVQPGSAYRAVGGSLVLPYGDGGLVVEVRYGAGTITPKGTHDVSGPDDGGDPVFSIGNDVYRVRLVGFLTEGTADLSSVTYTAATKTLSSTGGFANVAVGQFVYVSGGTGATAGWYEIATNADDDTVTLVTAPGETDQSDYAVSGANTLAGYRAGPATIQFGLGETWSGTVKIVSRRVVANWGDPNRQAVYLDLLFTGPVTTTTGAV